MDERERQRARRARLRSAVGKPFAAVAHVSARQHAEAGALIDVRGVPLGRAAQAFTELAKLFK